MACSRCRETAVNAVAGFTMLHSGKDWKLTPEQVKDLEDRVEQAIHQEVACILEQVVEDCKAEHS